MILIRGYLVDNRLPLFFLFDLFLDLLRLGQKSLKQFRWFFGWNDGTKVNFEINWPFVGTVWLHLFLRLHMDMHVMETWKVFRSTILKKWSKIFFCDLSIRKNLNWILQPFHRLYRSLKNYIINLRPINPTLKKSSCTWIFPFLIWSCNQIANLSDVMQFSNTWLRI